MSCGGDQAGCISGALWTATLDGGVECDHQESISGRTSCWTGFFRSKVSSSCNIFLKLKTKCRYRCGVCAGEGGRVRSVPVQGTAGEGDTLGRRGGESGLILESPAPLTPMAPATGAVVGAGFQGASSGRETENLGN